MAKASKYNRARIRSRVRRPKRRGGSMVWTVTTVVIILVGALLVVLSYADRQDELGAAPRIGDHWHAYLGVYVCGQWLPNPPEFEQRANDPGLRAGIHSHGDGLIHLHPFSSDESGAKATVGRFIDYQGSSLSGSSLKLWDGTEHRNGQKCGSGADAKPAEIQWIVGKYGKPWPTKPRSGNPADYRPKNGEIIGIYFVAKGDPLPEPPDANKALAEISDLAPAEQLPTPSGSTGSTGGTVPGGTGTTGSTGATGSTGTTATTTP
jgi:hypothetical protein